MALLIPILKVMVRFQGLITYSKQEQSVLTKYYFFQITNVFLTVLLVGSILGFADRLSHYIYSPGDFVKAVAASVPPQSNFYINYVSVSCITQSILLLLRPLDPLIFFIMTKVISTPKKDLEKPPTYPYSSIYGQTSIIFLVVLTYSTISPLILPFGIIYFGLSYLTVKYNIIYVFKQDYEGGGIMWPIMFNHICFGVGLYQITITGVLSINFFFTWSYFVFYYVYCNWRILVDYKSSFL